MRVKHAATEAEMDAYWPGGEENPIDDPLGVWIHCYANYVRFLGRLTPEEEAKRREAGDSELVAALREEPVPIELVTPAVDGGPAVVSVHPKSEYALRHLAARDLELLHLTSAWQGLTEGSGEEAATWAREVADEMGYQERVCVWAVTHEGCGLPFEPTDPRPAPPAWVLALDPGDLIRIIRAHQRVNGTRITLLQSRMAVPRSGGSMGWATVAAQAASELGVSSHALLRNRSLAAWLTQLVLTQEAKRQALEEARQEAGVHG